MQELEEIKRLSFLAAKKVLTVGDVCILTGLTKSYIYKLTSARGIPFYKPNDKTIYFKREDVEAWMLRGRVKSNEEINHETATHILNSK